jgi:NADPH-dependent 2,4-dienoyl-CoA reductase/sulfur reductase-like enzyme
VVDSRMGSSSAGLFAAGDCAEYRLGNRPVSMMLASTARACGFVAGSNAAGSRISKVPTGSFSERIFGLAVRSAGIGIEEARAAGYAASESSWTDPGESVCTVVFETRSRRLLGLQYAGRGSAPDPEFFALAVSEGILLDDILSLELPDSTDISPVREAAREGMRQWRRSSSVTT